MGYILRADGRWNRPGVYGCLYTSLTRKGVLAEFHKYRRRANVHGSGLIPPREIVSVVVDVNPVLDLTSAKMSPISPSAPFLTGDDPRDIEACRSLADSLRAQGFSGIVAPSAAAEGEKNLVIYIDGPARRVSLDVGHDRIPIRSDGDSS